MVKTATLDSMTSEKETPFIVHFPDVDERLDQDEEWCWLHFNGEKRKVRFHDYHEVYSIPGFYEHIFYDKLKCNSPITVVSYLMDELKKEGFDSSQLNVLDVGAGNGMVGEQLKKIGANNLYGIDIIKEAAEAARRDRPDVYLDYFVEDLTQLSDIARSKLSKAGINCLTTVAALGFGDIPPLAFAEAYNFVSTNGWLAFNIKEDFINHQDNTGFSRLIRRMDDNGLIDIRSTHVYCHRLGIDGTPLNYAAIVATKKQDIPQSWYAELE